LNVATNRKVHRVIFEGKTARGVELVGGEKSIQPSIHGRFEQEVANGYLVFATKEVILCAGAIDSPKLLLLSGIGDAQALTKLGIRPVLDQRNIGLELKDHPMLRLGALIAEGGLPAVPLAPGIEDMAAAAQGYLRFDTSKLKTAATLPPEAQSYLNNETLPTHELLLVSDASQHPLYKSLPDLPLAAYHAQPNETRPTLVGRCPRVDEYSIPWSSQPAQ
jgi:choline dehydrogenase-like flavoprotein